MVRLGAFGVFAGPALASALACALAGSDGPRVVEESPLSGTILAVPERRVAATAELLDALFAARFVLLGESHEHPEHHRLQALVIEALVARGRAPAVAFEMLPRDVQQALDALTRAEGPPPDAQRVRDAVAWDASGWPDFAIYSPVFEAALEARLPIVAADLGRGELETLGRGPESPALAAKWGLDEPLPAALREGLAEDIEAAHCGYVTPGLLPRMIRVQRARDAALAAALLATETDPGDGAVLIAGAEHVRLDRGAPRALARLAPGADARVLAFVELDPEVADPWAALAERYGTEIPFDFVWLTDRARTDDPCERFREALEGLARERGEE